MAGDLWESHYTDIRWQWWYTTHNQHSGTHNHGRKRAVAGRWFIFFPLGKFAPNWIIPAVASDARRRRSTSLNASFPSNPANSVRDASSISLIGCPGMSNTLWPKVWKIEKNGSERYTSSKIRSNCVERMSETFVPATQAKEWVVGASSGSEPAGYADSSTRAGKLHKRHQYQCVPVTNNCNHCRHENKFADNLTTHKKFLACGG